MKVLFISALCLFLTQDPLGCDKPQQPATKQEAAKVEHPPIRRFEHVAQEESGVALDTVTGQLCRTWNWDYTNRKNVFGVNTLPLCFDIYMQTPIPKATEALDLSGGIVPKNNP